MHTDLLKKKFTELRHSSQEDASLIDALHQWITQRTPIQRHRIHPYPVADDLGCPIDTLVRILLYGVPIGLFDLYWDTHCPHCHMIAAEHDDLSHLTGPSYCPMCEMDFEADFLQRVEVTFSLNPAIEELDIPPVCIPPAALNPRFSLTAARDEQVRGVETLAAGNYRYFCPATQAKGSLTVAGEPTEEVQERHVTQRAGSTFAPDELSVRPGPVAITLSNVGHPNSALFVTHNELPVLDPDTLPPQLSGLDIIHYPEFQQLFGDQVLSQRERLQIAAVTTLFTDITGSTRMYDTLGDAIAYNIVRDHFDILFDAIEQQGGRVVKTIGDAVMASFITNTQAMQSIVTFLDKIDRYNQQREDNEHVYLKIGIHRGAAILVNLNGRLDYFGSTINKAARIQALSGSCEITLSEEVYQDETWFPILQDAGLEGFRRHTVNLKGIEGEQTIYQISCKGYLPPHRPHSLLKSLRDMFGGM